MSDAEHMFYMFNKYSKMSATSTPVYEYEAAVKTTLDRLLEGTNEGKW